MDSVRVRLTGLEPQAGRLKVDLPLTRARPGLDRAAQQRKEEDAAAAEAAAAEAAEAAAAEAAEAEAAEAAEAEASAAAADADEPMVKAEGEDAAVELDAVKSEQSEDVAE